MLSAHLQPHDDCVSNKQGEKAHISSTHSPLWRCLLASRFRSAFRVRFAGIFVVLWSLIVLLLMQGALLHPQSVQVPTQG